MSRVLLAVPVAAEAQALSALLDATGDEVHIATSHQQAIEALQGAPLDQVLYDARLAPRGSDLPRTLAALREAGANVLIVAVGASDLGRLEAGMPLDDFLVRPWNPPEAQARLRHAWWRSSAIQDGNLVKAGDLVIDLVSYQVYLSGAMVALTYKEYELLRFLATNRGRVFSRDALLNRIWGYDYFGGGRTVDVHVRRLRSKIELGGRTFIETVRNVGYRFVDEAGGGVAA
jgi:two-component system, OmpR family, alkaline phosphatase synthesis response regulator PhoP